MKELVLRALYPFGGIAGGAMGQARCQVRMLGCHARVEVLGGIDFDELACLDFEMLGQAPAWCADVLGITAHELRRRYGCTAPHFVFLSPPCKGASGLISTEKAETAKYKAMNQLALVWMRVMLEAWSERPPPFVLIENVPRLKQRAPEMLKQIRKLLKAAGYVFSDGFHECGEIGGLAQIRRRYLLVARHAKQVPGLLYQPPKKRVRACGEVLGPLPLPGDPRAGRMHALPKLSWLNWVRLALIPAGGDWRDLEGVLRDGQARREVFKRHHVQDWAEPTGTVAGSGSNGPSAVADPRAKEWFGNVLRVTDWDKPVGTVTAGNGPTNGGGAVADPRIGFTFNENSHRNKYKVADWQEPAPTVMGATRPGSGAPSVADPRVPLDNVAGVELLRVKKGFDHAYGVLSPEREPSPTVAGGSHVGQGAYSVAYKRFGGGPYGVLDWNGPAGTVTGNAYVTTGKNAVADVRFGCEMRNGHYGVMSWQDAAATITGSASHDNGRFSVADPRKPPPELRIIIAADGTWHRPITTLECGVLQSFPAIWKGGPLQLHGKSISGWRERFGNAVPPDAAEQIGYPILFSFIEAAVGGFSLASQDTPVWISPDGHHDSEPLRLADCSLQ